MCKKHSTRHGGGGDIEASDTAKCPCGCGADVLVEQEIIREDGHLEASLRE